MGSPMDTTNLQDQEVEELRKNLFKLAMRGEWNKVVEKYKNNPKCHDAQITISRDTALHLAVRDGKDNIVEELVDLLNATGNLADAKKALEVVNDRKNTALHIAAAVGNARMCNPIAQIEPSLIGKRNEDGETPFFLAALNGNKDTFFCLHKICASNEADVSQYYRRSSDGETILHVAIAGDYYGISQLIKNLPMFKDLAFQIICWYEELANAHNVKGITPLHLLATKPNAFRSGTHLNCYHKIIYHCIFVEELKKGDTSIKASNNHKNLRCPQNYENCVNFLELLMDGFNFAMKLFTKLNFENLGHCLKGSPPPGDAENQQGNVSNGVGSRQFVPSNYNTCFDLVKLGSKGMLIVLGFGSSEIKKLRHKKEKHTWSVQLLDELLQRVELYEYMHTGKSPTPVNGGDEPYSSGESVDPNLNPEQRDKENRDEANPSPSNTPDDPTKSNETSTSGPKPKDECITIEMLRELMKECKELDKPKTPEMAIETPILIAAKNRITEMMEKILEIFPVAIHDMNAEKKNVSGPKPKDECITIEMLRELMKECKELDKPKTPEMAIETPILIAAKNGITEMMEKILEIFPVAIHDMNAEKKNAVLLAVENSQPHVYQLLLKRKVLKSSIFRKVDDKGNSALHLAATLGDSTPWRIPGAALQMQWELKWYEYVKNSMPDHFFIRHNHDNKTPMAIFIETHKELVKSGGEWLTHTSESCSVVAALIATVAFATAATVPGGVNQESGRPTLQKHSAFNAFALSSVVALCFSVTAVVMFLAILTSRYEVKDFRTSLPRKLLLGLTSLFVSIAAILVSFCTGHFFVLKDELRYAALPIYAVTCLPVTLFAMAQFPLYIDLAWASFRKVPQRKYMSVH